ncbi:tRNA pseudouridine(38-40) synthase TruA [Aureitalea sp. L0-47]|uniref:tRNA pseudouridine(38-40) synthase TruA n=1 Tax=Aureitalea sp. L0-47 TaxID=2816962 RepID=UPI002237F5F1|nr:tRNA pseudouridine(38-40) synthase TruA [Aureitalea sp. L0-47]MCW5519293.1 tRNA pseudouridine(38-40) synthase TruA [Aureitalea sp. L0-47]
MRYFIDISYHGKNYHGWQIQPEAISVQEVLERTISTLLRDEIKITGAGRTDTGVHARQLMAHFDCGKEFDKNEFKFRINSFLPKDIAVNQVLLVKDDAHARFDAVSREYQYYVLLKKDPFLQELSYLLHTPPDMELMNKASALLLGHQDFQCFSRSNTDVKTYYCDVRTATWEKKGDRLIFTIEADRFLRNMVRAVVGTLLDIGWGKTNLEHLEEILRSKDRSKAGASAPAHGLFLTKVEYPKTIFI